MINRGNEYYRLNIDARPGAVVCTLTDELNNKVYADAEYSYRVKLRTGGVSRNSDSILLEGPAIEETEAFRRILLRGKLVDITNRTLFELEHVFNLHKYQPFFDEQITLRKEKQGYQEFVELDFGFKKKLPPLSIFSDLYRDFHVVPIPFRRYVDGAVYDFKLWDLFMQPEICFNEVQRICCPEGWLLTDEKSGLLVMKHSQDFIEHSWLKIFEEDGNPFMQFGGAGIGKGDRIRFLYPEEMARTLGLTRYVFFEGGWKEGYYQFRKQMKSFGHNMPRNFVPQILYEPYYEYPRMRYNARDMYKMAECSRELGCEGIFIDTKWNKVGGAEIWDNERLGDIGQFGSNLKKKYGLSMGLHTTSTFTGVTWAGDREVAINKAFPGCYREIEKGREEFSDIAYICTQSGWKEEKAKRILKIISEVENGGGELSFIMFDGVHWYGRCHSEKHLHRHPLTMEDQAEGIVEVIQKIHEKFPQVLTELHGQVSSTWKLVYAPLYYLHGLRGSWDENWAFEFMWDPLPQILNGQALSLYYYNLAYDIPLFTMFPMNRDNDSLLMFWWFASTCRHFGIGGYTLSTEDRISAYKEAVKEYKRLREFFVYGTFYGIDEETHVHVLSDKGAVLVLFNLHKETRKGEIEVDLEQIKLAEKEILEVIPSEYAIWYDDKFFVDIPVQWRQVKGKVYIKVFVPPESAVILEMRSKTL